MLLSDEKEVSVLIVKVVADETKEDAIALTEMMEAEAEDETMGGATRNRETDATIIPDKAAAVIVGLETLLRVAAVDAETIEAVAEMIEEVVDPAMSESMTIDEDEDLVAIMKDDGRNMIMLVDRLRIAVVVDCRPWLLIMDEVDAKVEEAESITPLTIAWATLDEAISVVVELIFMKNADTNIDKEAEEAMDEGTGTRRAEEEVGRRKIVVVAVTTLNKYLRVDMLNEI